MDRLQAHLTLVVLESGRVVRVEHAHLTGGAAERVVSAWRAGPQGPGWSSPGRAGLAPGAGSGWGSARASAAGGAGGWRPAWMPGWGSPGGRGLARAPEADSAGSRGRLLRLRSKHPAEEWVVPVCLALSLVFLVAAFVAAR